MTQVVAYIAFDCIYNAVIEPMVVWVNLGKLCHSIVVSYSIFIANCFHAFQKHSKHNAVIIN